MTMKRLSRSGWLLIASAAWLMVALIPARVGAAPLAVFEARELLEHNWARTMVTYPVEFAPGQTRGENLQLIQVTGDARRPVPFQLWAVSRHEDGSLATARCSFYAELPARSSYRFELQAGGPGDTAAAPGAPTTTAEDQWLTLANTQTAIRLLPAGEHIYEQPVPLPEAPGPIRGIRLANNQWVGGSRFHANDENAPQVVSYNSRITSEGPMFAEGQVEYTLTNGEFYRMTARVLRDDPAVRIDEQWDFKRTGPRLRYQMVLELEKPEAPGQGQWSPDRLMWIAVEGGAGVSDEALGKRLAELEFPVSDFEPHQNFGSRAIAAPSEKPQRLLSLSPNYHWHPSAHYFALVNNAAVHAESDRSKIPFLAVVPMHAGNWRGSHGVYSNTILLMQPSGEVALHWPLQVGGAPGDYTQTGESDPQLPFSYGRRQWALVAGGLQYHDTLVRLRAYEGFVNLDDYKEWVLEWPDNPDTTGSGMIFSRREFYDIFDAAPDHPYHQLLESLLFYHDGPRNVEKEYEQTIRQVEHQIRDLAGSGGPGAPTGQRLPWVVNYRQTQGAGWANGADIVLLSEYLRPSDKAKLRARIAAVAYLINEPDVTRRGTMQHLGTPNMPINRFNALSFAAALLPDHPQYDTWMKLATDYLRYKMGTLTAPGGAWGELVTYYFAGAGHMIQAAAVLDERGYIDDKLAEQVYQLSAFLTDMTSAPDARFGARYVPNWGHGGWSVPTPFLLVAGMFRDKNPEYVNTMLWTWDQLGQVMTNHHDLGFSSRAVLHADLLDDMPEGYIPPRVSSRWVPGFGAVMRAHVGTENEIYLGYHQGYQRSHVDPSQGDFVLYGRGSPLLTISLLQYAIHGEAYAAMSQSFGWFNHIRTGQKRRAIGGAQVVSQVDEYAFGDDADYVRGRYQLPASEQWGRQVLMLKSLEPGGLDHVLIRDSFTGRGDKAEPDQPKWWSLKTLGEADRLTRDEAGFTYRSPYGGGSLGVRILSPQAYEIETRVATRNGPLYHQPAMLWEKMGHPKLPGRGTSIAETMSITAVGPVAPDADILAVLVPYREGETLPAYKRIADGVVMVPTPSGTDYAFLGAGPFDAEVEGIRFHGTAGAVRLRDDAVHLVITEGPGRITYQGITLISDGPAERIIPRAEIGTPKTITVEAAKHDITFALDASQGEITEVQPGVQRQTLPTGFAYRFHAQGDEPIAFESEEASFTGVDGGIVVNTEDGTIRLVMIDGSRIGQGEFAVQGQGPYDLTYNGTRIDGRTFAERGRFLYMQRPSGLEERVTLEIDGMPWTPGRFGPWIVAPVMPGSHEVALRTLVVPPVARNWQAW